VPLGHVPLAFVTMIEENKVGFSRNAFMVVTADRVYHLQADTPEEMQRWMQAIKKAQAFFKKQVAERQQQQQLLGGAAAPWAPVKYNPKEYKEGYLCALGAFKSWKQSYFVLKDGILYKFKNKGEGQSGRTHLFGCKFEDYQLTPPEQEITCWKINRPSGQWLVLRADSFLDMHEWLNAMLKQQLVIEEFINAIVFE